MTVGPDSVPITVTFQLSKSEYVKMVRRVMISLPRQKRTLQFLVIFGVLGLALLATPAHSFGTFVVVVDIIWIAIAAILFPFSPFIGWKRDPSLRSTRTVTITNLGVQSKTSLRTTDFQWTGIQSILETPQAIFLTVVGTQMVVLLPKRAINSPEDLAEIRRRVSAETSSRKHHN
jgi:hypothetical protein